MVPAQAAPALPLENLERLRHVKNGVSHLEARARDTAEALTTLLDEDEDMCMMRLSLLRERPRLFDPPISPELLTQHEDVELLLESYLQETEAARGPGGNSERDEDRVFDRFRSVRPLEGRSAVFAASACWRRPARST